MEYKLIRFTSDEKIKGKGDNHRIKICDSLDDYRINFKLNDYLLRFDDFCKNMPNEIEGNLIKKKSTIDFMDTMPFILGLKMIVSDSFVFLLKKMNVKNDEYFIKKIIINNFKDNFFLFFVPLIELDNVVFGESLIYNGFNSLKEERNYVKICDFENYKKNGNTTFEKLVLPTRYNDFDIIAVQGFGYAFSKRLFDAVFDSGLIGIEHDYTQELIVLQI
jgi:hypothetical protein